MLQIKVPGKETWDEKTEEFVSCPDTVLSLEHSLISISKWESKWHTPFLGKDQKTPEQIMDYIRCMTITPNVRDEVYACLTKENMDVVMDYINDPMTATTIKQREGGRRMSREIITSELIYYWMVALEIPFECQKWHINRLMMLIQICEIKNQPDKKMSKRSTAQQNAALNAARRQKSRSRG